MLIPLIKRRAWLALLVVMVTNVEAAERGSFSGAKPTEYPAWFKESFLNFEEDIAEATAAKKRLMILFHQAGCPYCNALVEKNLAQKDIETKVRKNFDVVAINLWGDREVVTIGGTAYSEKTLAESLKVQFTPTLIFFNEQGKVVLRLNGYLPPARFTLALDYVAGHKENQISFRDYSVDKLPPGDKGELIGEDFYSKSPFDLSKKPQLTAVFFEQKDCPNCVTLHKQVLADADTRKIIEHFQNIQLDMWAQTPVVTPQGAKTTAREWAKTLDVKYAPTIVLFNEKGEEVIRSEAFFKVFHTQGIFDYVLSGGYKNQPSFQRYLSNRAEHIREQGINVDIWRTAE